VTSVCAGDEPAADQKLGNQNDEPEPGRQLRRDDDQAKRDERQQHQPEGRGLVAKRIAEPHDPAADQPPATELT